MDFWFTYMFRLMENLLLWWQKGAYSVQIRFCETIKILILQADCQFPSTWSEKPNHLGIVPSKNFKTTLLFSDFSTKSHCICNHGDKRNPGLEGVNFFLRKAPMKIHSVGLPH